MFTKIVVKNIINALLLHLLNIHTGTGITNESITNNANSGPYGHSNACNSLKAISGEANVYRAYTHSRKKKKNHVVAIGGLLVVNVYSSGGADTDYFRNILTKQ